MEALTIEHIGNLIVFLAPGYLARAIYRSIFTKRELGATPTIILAALYSLPMVVIANQIVPYMNKKHYLSRYFGLKHIVTPTSTDWLYVTILFVLAIMAGYGVVLLRKWGYTRWLLGFLGFSSPEPSTYQSILGIHHRFSMGAIALKDGRTFSGVMALGDTEDGRDAKSLYFNHIRWPHPKKPNKWGIETNTALLVPLNEIKSIELDPKPQPPAPTTRRGKAWTLIKRIALGVWLD